MGFFASCESHLRRCTVFPSDGHQYCRCTLRDKIGKNHFGSCAPLRVTYSRAATEKERERLERNRISRRQNSLEEQPVKDEKTHLKIFLRQRNVDPSNWHNRVSHFFLRFYRFSLFSHSCGRGNFVETRGIANDVVYDFVLFFFLHYDRRDALFETHLMGILFYAVRRYSLRC